MGMPWLQNGRWPLFALIACLGFGLWATPNPGYLPRIGPAPLRFIVLPVIPTNPIVKSPPKVEIPKPEKVAEIAPRKKVAAPAPEPAVAPVTNKSNMEDLPAPALLAPSGGDGVVSPQMFLKYFGHPTNTAPVDPNATKPQGSSASYTIGP